MKQKNPPLVNCLFHSAELITPFQIKLKGAGLTSFQPVGWTLTTATKELPLTVASQQEGEIELELLDAFPFGEDAFVVHLDQACYVQITEVVRTESFDEMFAEEAVELGARYEKAKTSFAVWAPTATAVTVHIFDEWYDQSGTEYVCKRGEKGIWRVTVQGDLEMKWYEYEVTVNRRRQRVVDPYARFLSVNGERGMVGDLEKTNPPDWPAAFPPERADETEVLIYELHIRDFTIDPHNGIRQKGKYAGLAETGTHDRDGLSTGLSYLQELGITHVELLPLQEFGSIDESNREKAYNWGYDTTHFFTPEGSYATDPYDGYCRIQELKLMIQSIQRHGIKVIVDMVFNHVHIWEESALEKLVPGYYFRYHPSGAISNGTGVGNDIASERKMARKLIVDAVCYWLEEFQVDGFRFDLMGILDVETMKQISAETSKRAENLFLLGEGWDLPTALSAEQKASVNQAKNLPAIGFFADRFRDAIKGDAFSSSSSGYVSSEQKPAVLKAIEDGLKGSQAYFTKPRQAVHYVEAHDNHTLWDKLKVAAPYEDERQLRKRHRLACAIVLLAQGVPFLQAGQEFFRTKYGVENSYRSPDWVNQIDWKQRAVFQENVEYIKGLIALRRQHPALRLPSYQLIERHFHFLCLDHQRIVYHLDQVGQYDQWEEIVVCHNPTTDKQKIELPGGGGWQVVVDDQAASLIPLYIIGSNCAYLQPLSTLVCVKGN
ncbi:type I pullulanase [Halalkalibacter oceani]|uniref:type I pullulanase n=1 Tax=Halalkalibacter oceani TaxID=1653776 RepID=UPI0033949D8D